MLPVVKVIINSSKYMVFQNQTFDIGMCVVQIQQIGDNNHMNSIELQSNETVNIPFPLGVNNLNPFYPAEFTPDGVLWSLYSYVRRYGSPYVRQKFF